MKRFYVIYSFASFLYVVVNTLRIFSLIPPVIPMIASIAYLILIIILGIKIKKNKTKNTEDDSM